MIEELKTRIVPEEVTIDNSNLLIEARKRIDGKNDLDKLIRESRKYIDSENNRAFIIKEGDNALGYAEVNLWEEIPAEAGKLEELSDFAHLARIGVLVERAGFGTELLTRAEEWARKNGKAGIWLDYLVSNTKAAGFYSALGYFKRAEFQSPKGLRQIVAKTF